MTTPLYQSANVPTGKPIDAHAGLWFERFFNRYDENWTIASEAKQTWINSVKGEQGDKEKLKQFASRQQALVSVLQGESRFYKTDWHFVTGMGNPHPVENGFTWHPTLAVPYLAGSAVKGLVRAWLELKKAEMVSNENVSKKRKQFYLNAINQRLKDWFGTEDKKDVAEQTGNFIFFDALPSESPTLICDIMTPHMGDWYESGNNPLDNSGHIDPSRIPADWHEPVPVPFLAVKNAKFVFSIAACNPEKQAHVEELAKVFEVLDKALLWLGAGAKTATGYGYMEETNQSKQLREEHAQQQTKKAKEEQLALLSEAQKTLFLLREEVEKDPKPALQGSLRELLSKAIKQAETENWSTADKHALLEIGNALNSVWKADKLKKQLKTLQ